MNLRRHALGFLEAWPKPTVEELHAHYNNKYFGANRGQYTESYNDDEIQNKKVHCLEALHFSPEKAGKLLDLGCGEGFVLHNFDELGWDVHGADFTLDGVGRFFPRLKDKVRPGNLFDTIDKFVAEKKQFDFVTCNNVVEHVIDPLKLLQGIKSLMTPQAVCRIVVPNDDSYLQHELVRRSYCDDNFWVAPFDHLNYFNCKTFRATLEASGFKIKAFLADFPIDMFLFNPDTNYKRDLSKGKKCHYARMAIENMMARESIENLVAYRKGCAEAGVGRDIIAYCTL